MSEVYTTHIQSNMWSFINELDENQEYKEFIVFLNSDEFRSFGDGIAYLINKKEHVIQRILSYINFYMYKTLYHSDTGRIA